jgi:N-acetyl sugar amidotransferase
MDRTDPDIEFNLDGVCNHCNTYDSAVRRYVVTGEAGQQKIQDIVNQVSKYGIGKQYDCVIGLSGGVDSTFMAHKVKHLGLRPLAIHLDNGWDSELAVKNIENICTKLKIDLHTIVLDWEEFRGLQLAFLRASTPDSEIPSDHAISAAAVQTARKIGVKYIITGNNIRTETHVPRAWSQGHLDWQYIRSVNALYGTGELKTFPHLGWSDFYLHPWNRTFINILNFLDYSKKEAMPFLENELGWKYYGGKHYESIYTRWYQGYLLPKKFGYDKRRAHLSSLICSGEISREEALKSLENPTYSNALQKQDTAYVIKKLGLTESEFELIMDLPKKSYSDYPSYGRIYQTRLYGFLRKVYRAINR